jgi:hypothetical protein
MWVFPFSFCLLLVVMKKAEEAWPAVFGKANGLAGAACLLVFMMPLAPQTGAAYHEAAKLHTYHYIQNWAWYEWLGLLAPVGLFWWFSRIARTRQWKELERVCRALVLYDLIYFVAALAVDLPARFETLARMQPLRSLHLLYMVMFVVMGGLLGEFVLTNKVWRWLALFVPLSVGMFAAQRALFPASAHIEWPGVAPKNPWAQAFVWIRGNTDEHAVFALDPHYMGIPGEDTIGFRCLAERSRLADFGKDSGAVSMFPPLAEEWWSEVQAQSPWKSLRVEDFARLKQKYGVSWLVVQQPGVAGLDCAYENAAVKVCRVPD